MISPINVINTGKKPLPGLLEDAKAFASTWDDKERDNILKDIQDIKNKLKDLDKVSVRVTNDLQ